MALVPFPNQASTPVPDDDLDPDRDDQFDSDDEEAGGKMSFLEHLDELRKRIVYAVMSLAAGFIVCCFFIGQIFDFIMRPMQLLLPPGGTLVYTDPSEAFVLYIKIAAIAGLLRRVACDLHAGLALCRARPLLSREEVGDSVRRDVHVLLRPRRRVRALRRVSADVEVLRRHSRRTS